MTFGPYDFVHLYEAPHDEAMAKFVMTLGSFRNIRTTVIGRGTSQSTSHCTPNLVTRRTALAREGRLIHIKEDASTDFRFYVGPNESKN